MERLLSLFYIRTSSILPKEWKWLGKIETGSPADLTVLDPELEREVDVKTWKSKARLSPWDGERLKGWPVMTLVMGETVHIDRESFKGRG